MIRSLAEVLVIALFLLTFLVQPFRIPSASMEPTLKVGDFLLVDKQSFASEPSALRWLLPPVGVHRSDIAVFLFPPDTTRRLVKRVVGLPGDRIHLRSGRVIRNGELIDDPHAVYSPASPDHFRDDFPDLHEADPDADERWWLTLRTAATNGEVTVPPGEYFVLGDNRNNSEDSRYWGFVRQDKLVGRPLVVYFSAAWKSDPAATVQQPSSGPRRVVAMLRQGFHAVRIVR